MSGGPGLFTILARHRTFVVTLGVAVLLAGAISLTRLGSGIYPEVEFPRIVVVARAGDLTPALMQAAIVRPLETALASVPGVRRLRTRIIRGAAEIALQFEDGTTRSVAVRPDVDLSKRKVGDTVVIRITETLAIQVAKP